jgi:DNA-binding winged helix-turn-helix (wHTH) protein
MEQVSSPPTLKFGPFIVDLAAGEVRKNGSRIRLQEKPLRVLVLLAERQGQVVTRTELKQHLWPENTFVDFETGLNTAVSKLRDALSDRADSPRYIETIPRRGYRCRSGRIPGPPRRNASSIARKGPSTAARACSGKRSETRNAKAARRRKIVSPHHHLDFGRRCGGYHRRWRVMAHSRPSRAFVPLPRFRAPCRF